MASHIKLYLFGDQTFEIQPHLKTLFQKRDNLFLQDFLNKAYYAIRVELFKVPYSIRRDLPRFTCLEDLLLWDQSRQRCIALDMAMTTLYQLATFIRYIFPSTDLQCSH
ncbi:fusarubin cluster-polyketide synthase [Fusarium graminearum]